MTGIQKEGTPQEPISLAAEVQGGFDELGKFPARIRRYAKARAQALQTVAHLREAAQDEQYNIFEAKALESRAADMSLCGEYLHFRNYASVGKVRLHAFNSCRVHLLCPLCAIRRGAKSLGEYRKRYLVVLAGRPTLKGSMLTLTVKDGPNLLERFNHLRKIVAELLSRRSHARGKGRHQTEWAKIEGLVGSYEFKRGENSGEWHPHVHIAILHRERLDFVAMREEYKRISGDSHVFRVDSFQHPDEPERDFIEVFKYSMAFQELDRSDLVTAYLVLKGRRLLFSAGCLWGVNIPVSLEDESLEGLPFVDLFYRYTESGYSVAAIGSPENGWDFTEPDTDEAVRHFRYLNGTTERDLLAERERNALGQASAPGGV